MIYNVQYNNLFSVMTILSKLSLHEQIIRLHKYLFMVIEYVVAEA